MFQRFHAMKEERESGFTLIELLVVILIIAILAAIAIPVFLNQRKKGWTAQVESALKNAATANESFSTSNNGQYTSDVAILKTSEGLRYSSAAVDLGIALGTGNTSYCITGVSDNDSTIVRFLESEVGAPGTTDTAAAPVCMTGTAVDALNN